MLSEEASSAAGPDETNVPAPWRDFSTPIAERKPIPARNDEREIFNSRASSRSGGRPVAGAKLTGGNKRPHMLNHL